MRLRSAFVTAVLGIALVSPLAACSSAPAAAPSTAASAPAAPIKVDPSAWVLAARSPGTIVLDVRTPEEYAAGHLQGAININVESTDFAQQAAALDPAKTYAVYCHSGRRSAIAATTLANLGIVHVYDMQGGMEDAKSAGMPTA